MGMTRPKTFFYVGKREFDEDETLKVVANKILSELNSNADSNDKQYEITGENGVCELRRVDWNALILIKPLQREVRGISIEAMYEPKTAFRGVRSYHEENREGEMLGKFLTTYFSNLSVDVMYL